MRENQRVRLSKTLLQNSFVELLSEKSIHKISVQEICNNAQINRTTFYKYYANQYDLLKKMEDQVLVQIDSFLKTDKNHADCNIQALRKIAEYFEDNINLCRVLINNTMGSTFPEKIFNLSNVRILLDEKLEAKYMKDEMDYAYQFVVNGGFSVIEDWINKDKRESPEKIADIIINIISHLFK